MVYMLNEAELTSYRDISNPAEQNNHNLRRKFCQTCTDLENYSTCTHDFQLSASTWRHCNLLAHFEWM